VRKVKGKGERKASERSPALEQREQTVLTREKKKGGESSKPAAGGPSQLALCEDPEQNWSQGKRKRLTWRDLNRK